MTEEQVFLAALDLPKASDRAAYLDETCGADAGLRRQVDALLAAHFRTGAFLDVPAAVQVEAGSNHDKTVAIAGEAMPAEKDHEEEPDDLNFLSPSPRPDSLGRLGHYEVLQVLGKGGFGIVFRAFDDILQRVVAVKVMAPQLAATSPARRRFLREARSSAAVRHDNVVQVYEVGEQPLPYLVMEFVPGETLQQKLDRSGPLDLSEMLRIGRQVAEGLAAAHACDLIHRDIKPGNILLEGGSHKAKITDFGLARAADDASISQSGFIAGTPMFMSPEQALGHQIDQRADLFSLGSVLYQMASGRPPFRAPSALAVLKRVAEEPPRPIAEIIPETPAWLCGIIAKLHAKNPADRFQSAREVADLLADCEAKLKAKQEVKNVLPGAAKPAGRKWVAAAAVLLFPVIALAVTELAGVTHLFWGQHSTPPSVAKQDPLATDTKVADAAGKEPDPTKVPEEKKTPLPDPKPPVEVPPPAPTVHDTWIKAHALLPPDQHAAALPARLKERLPAFDDAFLRAFPAMSADRQVIMAKAWLKERNPALAGREDAWLKVMLSMAADAQVVLVAAWLRERNPVFADPVPHQIEDGVVTSLEIPARAIQDLLPLRALTGLKTLTCRSTAGWDNKAESDAAVLRSLRALETINGKPVAQFWKDAEARQAEFKEWCQLVPALTAPQQAKAVVAKLKERNPGFDEKLQYKIEDGAVTEFGMYRTDQVTDLSPIRVLGALRVLDCTTGKSTPRNKVLLTDLTPLRGMSVAQLTQLYLRNTNVGDADLALFKDCRNLTILHLTGTTVSDAGMVFFKDCEHLTNLGLGRTKVSDAGMVYFKSCKNLTILYLKGAMVGDTGLGHFKSCKNLTVLDVEGTQVGDVGLAHFKGMPLKFLSIYNTGITDLTPLQGMPLEEIYLTPKNIIRGLDILRDMKSLITIGINGSQFWPAAEFWERHDRGEFK